MLIVTISVWNEEEMLPGALKSLERANVDSVVVFDGAWEGFADPGEWLSTDRTVSIAKAWGAEVIAPVEPPWRSQEVKRTAMFHQCGADEGDYIYVMDADERLEGRFPNRLPASHACILIADAGENDLPGIRGEWPNGDYSRTPKPEIRLFRWSTALHCIWPGGYVDETGRRIKVYADDAGTSYLPVLDTITATHHAAERSPDRIQRKIRYYQDEHPRRYARQRPAPPDAR